MTERTLSKGDVKCLRHCYSVASENYSFYARTYDVMAHSPDRELIGSIMAQKKSFLDAAKAILSNHNEDSGLADVSSHEDAVNMEDNSDAAVAILNFETLVHEHERNFTDALISCVQETNHDQTKDLYLEHKEAADIALTALKEKISANS